MGGQQVCAIVLALAVLPVGQVPRATTSPSAKLQLRQTQVHLQTSTELLDGIWTMMFDYQKAVQKDLRANQKLAKAESRLDIDKNAAKLQKDIEQIERQMDEASQKAQTLMDAAEGAGSWEPLVNHLRSVQTLVRGLVPRTPTRGTQTQAGPDLQRALDRFEQLKARVAVTSKGVDEDIKKK